MLQDIVIWLMQKQQVKEHLHVPADSLHKASS